MPQAPTGDAREDGAAGATDSPDSADGDGPTGGSATGGTPTSDPTTGEPTTGDAPTDGSSSGETPTGGSPTGGGTADDPEKDPETRPTPPDRPAQVPLPGLPRPTLPPGDTDPEIVVGEGALGGPGGGTSTEGTPVQDRSGGGTGGNSGQIIIRPMPPQRGVRSRAHAAAGVAGPGSADTAPDRAAQRLPAAKRLPAVQRRRRGDRRR
ncbi:hypothetical protein [Brachybacterium sp. GPGPB12]|uniref:hypothetical protein n=1 Tax=Brachybacterium sp. GPGPB12 TaxID=3023517 RepID=UPI0031343235